MRRALASGLALLCAVGWGGLAAGCARNAPVEARPDAVVERLLVAPGVEVELVRFAPVPPVRGRPVLLVHGMAANARHLDLDERHSMARWFAAHGRETWTVSTRVAVVQADGRIAQADFDTLWQEDLTRVLGEIRRRAVPPGVDVDVVGHSMGGMMLYAYLSQGGEGVHAGATLGSPTRFDWGSPVQEWLARRGPELLAGEGVVPLGGLTFWLTPLHGRVPDSLVERLFYNPKLMDTATWRHLMAVGVTDLPNPLTRQFVRWMGSGRFDSVDGRVDYRADMARIRTPLLVVAGRLDRMAVAPAVRDGYLALGGPKAWLLMGEETFARHDYGHMDLILGNRAEAELWPRLLEFLDRSAN